jgi:hypothetical protein
VEGTSHGLVSGTILVFTSRNSVKSMSQDNQFSSQDSNQPPPEHKAQPVPVEATCSVHGHGRYLI